MIRWAVERPAVVRASAAGLLIAGGVAFMRLPLATRPVVELPRLSIAASWPGASAELVESHVTAPLEAAVQSVRGVRRVDSESREGSASLTAHLAPDEDVQMVRLAIHERLELLRDDLPPGAAPPTLTNYVPEDLAEQPLLSYTISGPYTPGTLARLLRARIEPVVAAVPGVGGVAVRGGSEQSISVAYDRSLMARLDIRPDVMSTALTGSRIVRALGTEQLGASARPVVLRDEPADLAALAALPVAGPGGRLLRVGDLSSVRQEEDSRDQFYRIDGEPAVSISITRSAGADAIRTAAAVRHSMESLRPTLPAAVALRLQTDHSEALKRQLESLLLRTLIAMVAVVVVLLVALRSPSLTMLVMLSALVAVAGTALGLYLLGIQANLLTLAGLGMGIGILVQNGVVVIDRLRGVRDGAGRAAAARAIAPAVLGATLTTAVVLLPFLYLQGNARAAFMPFAAAFVLALGWSIVSSVVMLPAVSGVAPSRSAAWRGSRRRYGLVASRLLRWRWLTLALGAALVTVAAWGFVKKVPRSSWTWWGGQRDQLRATLSFPRGSDPQSLDRGMREFESIVVGRNAVDQVTVNGTRDFASMTVSFEENAGAQPFMLQEELTRRALVIGGAGVSVTYIGPGFHASLGGGGSVSQRIKLLGYSYDELERIALDLKRRLERIPRVRDVDINAGSFYGRERAFSIVLRPDRAALAGYGLTAQDLAAALGREVGGAIGQQRLVIGGEEMQVLLKDAGARTRTLDELRMAIIPAPGGVPVRIGDVARVDEEETLARISRQDQQYVRIIGYDFRGPQRLAERTHRAFMRSVRLPPGYSASDDYFGWQADESGRLLWLVFAIGVVLVILVVAMVFDSGWATAMVFLSLPLALAGSAAAFWIAKAAFTREAAVGVVLVVGLAVNQSILLVDAVLEKRRRNGSVRPADVLLACRDRAGMIMLVTFTTLASLIPLAIGTKPDELFGAIALATTGGTIAGTLGALLILPAMLPGLRRR